MVDTLVDGVTLQESGGVVVHEPYRVRAVLELTQLLHTICVVLTLSGTPWKQILVDAQQRLLVVHEEVEQVVSILGSELTELDAILGKVRQL